MLVEKREPEENIEAKRVDNTSINFQKFTGKPWFKVYVVFITRQGVERKRKLVVCKIFKNVLGPYYDVKYLYLFAS